MAGKLKISYRYSGPDEYENAREPLRDIIKADTGEEFWIETRSYPPMGFPPLLHVESVEKLKKLREYRFRNYQAMNEAGFLLRVRFPICQKEWHCQAR